MQIEQPNASALAGQGPGDELDLRALISVVRSGIWVITACVVLGLIVARVLIWVEEPSFRTEATIQIENQAADAFALGDLFGDFQLNVLTSAEIEIMRSRRVVGETVRNLALDVSAEPNYLPVLGQALSRSGALAGFFPPKKSSADQEDTDLIESAGYTWDRADVQVGRFETPVEYHGRTFFLVGTARDQFTLYAPDGEHLASGQSNKEILIDLPGDRRIGLFVQGLSSLQYPVLFKLQKHHWRGATEQIRRTMKIEPLGATRNVSSGILQVSLEGEDAKNVTRTLNGIIDEYIQQHVAQRAQSAQKGIEFLDTQLINIQADLRAAESRLNDYRKKHLALDLTSETQSLLGDVVKIESRLRQLRAERAQLSEQVTNAHPVMRELDEEITQVSAERTRLEERVESLPGKQQELLELQRDVEVSTGLFTTLQTKAQELRLLKAGTVGSARLIDPALLPREPIVSKKLRILFVGFMIGLMVGVAFVILRFVFRSGVYDAAEIEREFGKPVYAVVPLSRPFYRFAESVKRNRRLPILSVKDPDEPAVEGLRSFRTALHFAVSEKSCPVIVMTGPCPNVGKSFLSINLAALLAQSGSRTLVIDGDMRRGHLHRYEGIARSSPGLSDVLGGRNTMDEALQSVSENLKVLTRGRKPPNPSELLMSEKFSVLIKSAKPCFDYILIDTPPVLAVTDPEIVAGHADQLFVALRAGVTSSQEIRACFQRLLKTRVGITGVILNGYEPKRAAAYGYGYGQGQYYTNPYD